MKPRIYKRDGLWYCRVLACAERPLPVTGIGFDPFEAYEDWRKA